MLLVRVCHSHPPCHILHHQFCLPDGLTMVDRGSKEAHDMQSQVCTTLPLPLSHTHTYILLRRADSRNLSLTRHPPAQPARYFSFAITDSDGSRSYATCLQLYQPRRCKPGVWLGLSTQRPRSAHCRSMFPLTKPTPFTNRCAGPQGPHDSLSLALL